MTTTSATVTTTAPIILDGKGTAATIRSEVAAAVAEMKAAGKRAPGLAAVLVGDDPASSLYVASKGKDCEEVGMVSHTHRLPATTSEPDLLALVDRLNADDSIDGILVQLPLPSHLSGRRVLDRIDPAKDVDGFHPVNVGNLWLDQPGFLSATPAGILELLRRYEIPLAGMHAVVLGRSAIVGKPMAGLLLRSHCTVTVCHSRTRDLPAITRQADILVAAIGKAGMVGEDHVKEGAIVIDVGINRVDSEDVVRAAFPGDEAKLEKLRAKGSILVGDVDYDRVAPRCRAITPVPGGVGPLTRAMLLVNTLAASRARQA